MSLLAERVWIEAQTMEVFCKAHPLDVLRPRLRSHRILPSRALREIPSGRRVRVAGLMILVHTPPTRSGRRVMFVTMEDETGLLDLVVFPEAQTRWARAILTSEVLAAEGVLKREGRGGRSLSIVLERVLPRFSGPLGALLAGQGQQVGRNGLRIGRGERDRAEALVLPGEDF